MPTAIRTPTSFTAVSYTHLGGCVHPVEVYGGAVVGLKLIMTGLGLRHQVGSLLKKLGGGPLVEAETGAVARQILPVHEAGAPDGLHTGQLDGMPPVVGEESRCV